MPLDWPSFWLGLVMGLALATGYIIRDLSGTIMLIADRRKQKADGGRTEHG